MPDFHTIEAKGISVTLDLRVGHVRDLTIERDGRVLWPLHTAPWVDELAITGDEAIPANLRFLSGDFFCAPFGASDLESAPPHGWTANSRWHNFETRLLPDGAIARYRLERKVMGATVEKTFTLRDGHPFLYQTHSFMGGSGALPVANHAMVQFPAGGLLTFSAKSRVETPETAPEPDAALGRSRLAYPARSDDPTHMPLADGGIADLTRYPFAERHEDVVMLVEDRGNRFGWLAALKPESGEVFLTLKRPADYPATILWFSNGGRDYPPWNGRHVGVLGIEEGRVYLGGGHRAAIEPNPTSEGGTPTALVLMPGGRVDVRNAIGGLHIATDSGPVAEIRPDGGRLTMRFRNGTDLDVPFDSAFLERS